MYAIDETKVWTDEVMVGHDAVSAETGGIAGDTELSLPSEVTC